MSRRKIMSDSRCPICGGRMRLVNVTRVNTFRTPEASLYDLSVSNRNTMFGNTSTSSSQELMCSSCSNRSPLENGTFMATGRKKRKGAIIGWIIFIVVLIVAGVFAYIYRDMLGGVLQSLGDMLNNAKNNIVNLFKK